MPLSTVFAEGCFAKQRGLGGMTNRLVFKHGYQRATGRGQVDVFEQLNNAMLVNHGFKRLDHASSLSDSDRKREEKGRRKRGQVPF